MGGRVDHIWYGRRKVAAGKLALDTLIATASGERGPLLMALIEDEYNITGGSADELFAAFDAHVLDSLVTGSVPSVLVDDDARAVCKQAAFEVIDGRSCNHLHQAVPLSVPVNAAQAGELLVARDVLALVAPPVDERLLLIGASADANMHAMVWSRNRETAMQLAMADARFRQHAPLHFVADVVHVGGIHYQLIDVLGFDGLDVRGEPFAARRAMGAELVGEIGLAELTLVAELGRPRRGPHTAGAILFAELDAPYRPLWGWTP